MVRERDNLPPMRLPIHIFLTSLNGQVNSAVKSILKESYLGLKKLHKDGESYKRIACKKRFRRISIWREKIAKRTPLDLKQRQHEQQRIIKAYKDDTHGIRALATEEQW